MAKLEDTRNVGKPVVHMDMDKMSIFSNPYPTSVYPSQSIHNAFSDENSIMPSFELTLQTWTA